MRVSPTKSRHSVADNPPLSLRRRLGALVHDWPRFLRYIGGDWTRIHNRDEAIATDGRGVLCQWEYGSDLHIAAVFPSTARWLLRRALADHAVSLRDDPVAVVDPPQASFVIGHRGRDRLPLLLTTLRNIATQRETAIECIVVEQSARPEVQAEVPRWVRYLHTPVEPGIQYSRSAAFNAGAAVARGEVLIFHDNDMLVPERYAAETATRVREGWRFMDLKRFIFYVSEEDTRALVAGGSLRKDLVTRVAQNLHGGSIAAGRQAFFEIGGFDDEFIAFQAGAPELPISCRKRGQTIPANVKLATRQFEDFPPPLRRGLGARRYQDGAAQGNSCN